MKVSIITVALNNAEYIETCIQSVINQDYENIEYIVIDGGSTDGTLDILGKYGFRISRLVSEPDEGMYDALNKGLRLASGAIVGLLHADDIFAHDLVLSKVAAIFHDTQVASCYGDLLYVSRNDPTRVVRYWKSGPYSPRRFYRGWMPPHPTFFVKRPIYEKYGMFNLALGSAADYELMLRFLLKNSITCTYIPEILVKMRTGGQSNASLRNRIRAHCMDRRAWQVNGLRPYPWTLLCKPLSKIWQYIRKPL